MSNDAWDVRLTAGAARELHGLNDQLTEQIQIAFEELAEDPFPADSIQLEGYEDLRRIAFEHGWRIIYRVSRSNRRVTVIRIKPRGSVYSGLQPRRTK